MMNGGRAAYSNFDNAAYLTEIILLGCIALRVGKKKMEWDGPNMKSPNTPEAAQYVKRDYLERLQHLGNNPITPKAHGNHPASQALRRVFLWEPRMDTNQREQLRENGALINAD